MIEHKHGKHVIISCNLSVGERVTVNGYHYLYDKKPLTITKIKQHYHCESGFMVMTQEIGKFIDSNWIDKL